MKFKLAFLTFVFCGAALCGGESVIASLNGFESEKPGERPPLSSWRWSAEEKANAGEYSEVKILAEGFSGGNCLKLRLSESFPWPGEYVPAFALSLAYFPPETDAVKLRVKVLSGSFMLSVGGPTAYFGNSDVFARPKKLDKATAGEWADVEFDLNKDIMRNMRRAGCSSGSPRVYYNRWAQEPTFLYLFKPSSGEILIDDIRLAAKGEGRPFKAYASGEAARSFRAEDFQKEGRSPFTILMDDPPGSFDASWQGETRPRHPPPEWSFQKEPQSGISCLKCSSEFFEEVKMLALPIVGEAKANAIGFRMKAESTKASELAGRGEVQPLDVILFCGADGEDMLWAPLGPSPELKNGSRKGYDVKICHRELLPGKLASLSAFHARRFLKLGEWSDTAIPLADFACIAGYGKCRADFLECRHPQSANVRAVAFLFPWPRAGRASDTFWLEKLEFLKLPGDPDEMASYWQIGSVKDWKLWEIKGASPSSSFFLMLRAGKTP